MMNVNVIIDIGLKYLPCPMEFVFCVDPRLFADLQLNKLGELQHKLPLEKR